MEMIVAFTACVLLVALGDILSIASRAKIPAMAGIILLYLAATALGMPQEWPALSGLAPLGDLMFPVFVAAVTTNILPRDVVRPVEVYPDRLYRRRGLDAGDGAGRRGAAGIFHRFFRGGGDLRRRLHRRGCW